VAHVPPYMGVPLITVPAIPTNLAGILGHSGTNLSYGFLTPRDNLIFGIHREIRIDKDKDVQEEVRNVARSVVSAVCQLRAGKLAQPDRKIKWPRPK